MQIKLYQVYFGEARVYGYFEAYEKTRAKMAELAEKLDTLKLADVEEGPRWKESDDGSQQEDYIGRDVLEQDTYWFTSEELLIIAEFAKGYEVKQVVTKELDVSAGLARMAEKPELLASQPSSVNYNNKCEVHMPGQALSVYNELMLMEDICTDALQGSLDDGWRIIAACPQPDQRRPDYILGRYNPNHEVDTNGAERG